MKIFSANFPAKEGLIFQDIIDQGLRELLTEVCKVMELIFVIPATTASPERSFSRLKLIKTPKINYETMASQPFYDGCSPSRAS